MIDGFDINDDGLKNKIKKKPKTKNQKKQFFF